jgi:hypothetical protein
MLILLLIYFLALDSHFKMVAVVNPQEYRSVGLTFVDALKVPSHAPSLCCAAFDAGILLRY